jgi:uncharacterized protein YjbJ (UPF0337 family)
VSAPAKELFTGAAAGHSATQRERTMNEDQVKGRVEEAKGKVKEVAGKVVGNERLEAEGDADQVAGKVQSGVGDAKEQVKKGIDKL